MIDRGVQQLIGELVKYWMRGRDWIIRILTEGKIDGGAVADSQIIYYIKLSQVAWKLLIVSLKPITPKNKTWSSKMSLLKISGIYITVD